MGARVVVFAVKECSEPTSVAKIDPNEKRIRLWHTPYTVYD